jgi:peptidoglycan/LPS O-acetylase OafA/YrhL
VNTISPAYSRYLDLLRGLAALMVVLSHLKLFGIASGGFTWWLPDDGHDAVVLFFIISGFVIAASTTQKANQGLKNYLLDRAARIYSVAAPILLIAALFCAVGWINIPARYQLEKLWLYIPFHLSFLSQSWYLRELPFGLNPWWSLPFEVWYYILFGCAFFLKGKRRLLSCLIVLMIMGPKLWVMLPIWMVGVWLYRSNFAATISKASAWFFLFAGPVGYLLFMETSAQLWVRDILLIPFGGWNTHSLGYASYFGRDYVTALFFVVHLVGMQKLGLRMPGWMSRSAQALAGVSFTLYLLHPIIFRALADNMMPASSNPLIVYAVAGLSVVSAFLVAFFTEGQRKNWRRLLQWLTTNRLS